MKEREEIERSKEEKEKGEKDLKGRGKGEEGGKKV